MNQQTVQQTNEDNSFELRRRAVRIAELVAALEELVNARKAGNIAEEHWDNARVVIAKAQA